jgi:hypothetical protein
MTWTGVSDTTDPNWASSETTFAGFLHKLSVKTDDDGGVDFVYKVTSTPDFYVVSHPAASITTRIHTP